jgi:protein transport protein SEC61 subunit alpha
VSGLAYYCSPPISLYNAVYKDHFHFLVFTVFVLVACVFFAHTWIYVIGMDSKVVCKQLKDQNLVIKGYKDGKNTLEKVFGFYIPSATTIGKLYIYIYVYIFICACINMYTCAYI